MGKSEPDSSAAGVERQRRHRAGEVDAVGHRMDR